MNKTREKKDKPILEFIFTKAYVLEVGEPTKEFNKRLINNIKDYYNFFNDNNFVFKSKVISDYNESIRIDFKDRLVKRKNQNQKKNIKETIILPIEQSTSHLTRKYLSISNLTKNFSIPIVLNLSEVATLERSLDFSKKDVVKNYYFCNELCTHCKANCSYSLCNINPTNKQLTVSLINKELSKHNHPKSRKKTSDDGKQQNRNREEALAELFNHYAKFHKKIE